MVDDLDQNRREGLRHFISVVFGAQKITDYLDDYHGENRSRVSAVVTRVVTTLAVDRPICCRLNVADLMTVFAGTLLVRSLLQRQATTALAIATELRQNHDGGDGRMKADGVPTAET